MARISTNIKYNSKTAKVSKQVDSNVKEAVTDVVMDLKRVASESAPHKEGFLEKSTSHDVSGNSRGYTGAVGFSAFNEDGFNYAEWTHEEDYNLGKKSKKKAGGKSVFGSGTVPVGKGYLENALSRNKKGYLKHIGDAYGESIS